MCLLMQACSNISWGTIPQRQHAAAIAYKGNICKYQLSLWQSCVSDKIINICNQSSETETEAKAKHFRAKIGEDNLIIMCNYG